MKFEIKMPESKIDEETKTARNRAMFKQDYENEGLLSKVLVFLYQRQPCSVTDLTNSINAYYGTDIDRVKVYRAISSLVNKNIIKQASTTEISTLSHEELDDMQREAMRRYFGFLSNIPKQFKSRFAKMNYFWVSNGEGHKYIEWCCKLLGFQCEKTEEEVKKIK